MLGVLKCIIILSQGVFWLMANGAPGKGSKSWPPMRNYDIWESPRENLEIEGNGVDLSQSNYRQSRGTHILLNFFPVPVDDECLSDDGRRSGICLNVYECRLKGGIARGECALGFGVCCVFVASCDQDIANNITYIISPNFPSSMPNNLTSCKVKVKLMSPDISQLRIDFHHFALGQPNRKTGVCDGDVFQVSGGLGGPFILCGQNSGQHVYYDVGGRVTARQAATVLGNGISNEKNNTVRGNTSNYTTNEDATVSNAEIEDVEILVNLTNRILPTRLWEIRVTQIPFSQRAPAGCLQYFTGQEGIIQTFNFADNGRHLANQDYKACIRQEKEMCSIAYEPCDEQSFKIGPTIVNDEAEAVSVVAMPSSAEGNITDVNNVTPYAAPPTTATFADDEGILGSTASDVQLQSETTEPTIQSNESPSVAPSSPSVTPQTEASQSDQSDTIDEGSGGGDIPPVSAAPVRGGFDVFSFLRSTFFNFRRRRSGRQIYTACTDRITMPCIVEDFIGAGLGTIPDCEPVHCGDKFCSYGSNLCRIESTVTPFYLGIHFGDGNGKGSPEDNIGACLRFTQMTCM